MPKKKDYWHFFPYFWHPPKAFISLFSLHFTCKLNQEIKSFGGCPKEEKKCHQTFFCHAKSRLLDGKYTKYKIKIKHSQQSNWMENFVGQPIRTLKSFPKVICALPGVVWSWMTCPISKMTLQRSHTSWRSFISPSRALLAVKEFSSGLQYIMTINTFLKT